MKYKIYYANGTTYSDQDGAPEDAPGLGVIVIVIKHPDTRVQAYLQHEADYYIWAEDKWWACDLFRLWQYWFVQKYDHQKVSLAGETVRNELYEQIVKAAKSDKDFYG